MQTSTSKWASLTTPRSTFLAPWSVTPEFLVLEHLADGSLCLCTRRWLLCCRVGLPCSRRCWQWCVVSPGSSISKRLRELPKKSRLSTLLWSTTWVQFVALPRWDGWSLLGSSAIDLVVLFSSWRLFVSCSFGVDCFAVSTLQARPKTKSSKRGEGCRIGRHGCHQVEVRL